MKYWLIAAVLTCIAFSAQADLVGTRYTNTAGDQLDVNDSPATVFGMLECDRIMLGKMSQIPAASAKDRAGMKQAARHVEQKSKPAAAIAFGNKHGADASLAFKKQVKGLSAVVEKAARNKGHGSIQEVAEACYGRAKEIGGEYGE